MEETRPVPITVTFSRELTPRARRITFSGMSLIESTKPASYLSLFFEEPSPDWPPPRGAAKPPKRTYTPRYVDPSCESITIDFVLHGAGKATDWARTATAGDVIWAGTTSGGYDLPAHINHLVLVGDDTAIPAIGTVLEAIPRDTRKTVIIEVVDEDDERQPSDVALSDPIWLHRGTDATDTGIQSLNLIRSIAVPPDTYWWIAGEREAIRTMRDSLVRERGVHSEHISLNAYWRLVPMDPRER